jgi:hypothetical protein
MVTKRAERAAAVIDQQIGELSTLSNFADKGLPLEAFSKNLEHWEQRTIALLSETVAPGEAKRLEKLIADIAERELAPLLRPRTPLAPFQYRVQEYTRFLLALRKLVLRQDKPTKHPEIVLPTAINEGKASVVGEQPLAASVKTQAALSVTLGGDSMKVFISHISEEAPLAHVLKEWMEGSFPGLIEVFVSSDIHDLPGGRKWLDEIDTALQDAQLFLVLCSPHSLPRPWINFETGCAWIKRIPILPLCHSGQAKGNLPPPISEFQALEVEDPSFIGDFLSSLAEHLSISKLPRIDQRAMKDEIGSALAQIAKTSGPAPATEKLKERATNELVDIIYSTVYGLSYENLMVHAEVDDEGAVVVTRQSKVVAHSAGVKTLDQYLFSEASEGTIKLIDFRCLTPFRDIVPQIQKTSASNFSLALTVTPALMAGESIEFVSTEKTPPGAVTLTYQAMAERNKAFPYECFYWDITRPTFNLQLLVRIPLHFQPQSSEPDVWYGGLRVRHDKEYQKIKENFHSGRVGTFYELRLNVKYPLPGLRYAIKWIPKE